MTRLGRSLISKVVLAYVLLGTLAIPILWFYISGSIENYFISRIEENLKSEASLIVLELPPLKTGQDLDALAEKYKGLTGARVTIINADGVVLGDSDKKSSLMENHLGRPEVQEALASGWGSSTRYSHTLERGMVYLAVKAPSGFVRLSMELKAVDEAMARIKERVAAGAFVIFVASVFLGLFLSRRLARRVEDMAAFTGKIARGDFSSRIAAESSDELGVLAENLNLMAVQLKKNVEALSKEKVILTAVLRGMAEGVMVTDAVGRVIIVNPAFMRTFGIKEESAVNRPLVEVIRNEGLLNLYKQAHSLRDYVSGEIETGLPEPMYFIAGCVPLVIEDKFSGIVIVLHDITRMQALERVRRDFVANVTHELKTPIAAIQGFAETLIDGALEDKEKAHKFLGIIESNSRRLTRLVEDLMMLSRIELGEIKLNLRPVQLKDVAGEAALLLEPKIKEKDIKVIMDFPSDMPPALADRDRLYQIILNVLDNAVKYTPKNESVTIAGRPGKTEASVEISITDSGPGIPPEMLPRMGERFFRVDPARSRELGGTGLGLAIVKHLVRLHGGSFNIENLVLSRSTGHGGTRVTLAFKSAL